MFRKKLRFWKYLVFVVWFILYNIWPISQSLLLPSIQTSLLKKKIIIIIFLQSFSSVIIIFFFYLGLTKVIFSTSLLYILYPFISGGKGSFFFVSIFVVCLFVYFYGGLSPWFHWKAYCSKCDKMYLIRNDLFYTCVEIWWINVEATMCLWGSL